MQQAIIYVCEIIHISLEQSIIFENMADFEVIKFVLNS